MRNSKVVFGFWLACLAALGCGKTEGITAGAGAKPATVCVAGSAPISCDCGGGTVGSKTCSADGLAWSACAGCPTTSPPATPTKKSCGNTPDGQTASCGAANVGACHYGTKLCNDGVFAACSGNTDPQKETCNGIDDDCDGLTDNGIICQCKQGDPPRDCGNDIGQCRFGSQSCVSDGKGNWYWSNVCVGGTWPKQETCDGQDNDCNGTPDNGFDFKSDPYNCGACGVVCARPNAFGTCVESVCQFQCQPDFYNTNKNTIDGCEYHCPVIKPLAKEDCTTPYDDNCDGNVNEGCDYSADPLNCGAPNRKCSFDNASATCIEGDCRLGACKAGYVDKDKNPWNGCEYSCTKTSATEVCGNRLDDNCDGEVDEGCDCNPQDKSSVLCGNNTGVCKAVKTCQANGKWSDCSVLMAPSAKSCNKYDNDCNGLADNGEFDLQTDVQNCGACGNACSYPNATALCVKGVCQMGSCVHGYNDLNKKSADGCEYSCLPTNNGTEQCDGIDNECNGLVDDGAVCECQYAGAQKDCGSNVGACKYGKATCSSLHLWGTCDMTLGVGPKPETCNGVDDDCDGVADNGINMQADPLNCGACNVKCPAGNGTAACVAGKCSVGKCNPGYYPENDCTIGPCVKTGPETCNGLDDDCNGKVDDGVGACDCVVGSTQTCGNNVGSCHAGVQKCVAPGKWDPACVGGNVAKVETCNSQDDDCDGVVDNGYATQTDVLNCGACGNACKFDHATASCVAGKCQMVKCDQYWYDIDGLVATGCEVPCVPTNGGVERCDKVDNNCNGKVDEGFDTQNDLLNCGSCGTVCNLLHATPVCTKGDCVINACNSGFVDLNKDPKDGCEYVCTPTNGGTEICDGLDNDCDGTPDDGIVCNCQNGLTRECGTGLGMCVTGKQVCVSGVWGNCSGAVDPKPIVCDLNTDLNCDGVPDGQQWVTTNDVNNCGGCNIKCSYANASASCVNSVCVRGECNPFFYDFDHNNVNGCEAHCDQTNHGVEQCDGIDNNCNGQTDEGFDLQTDPANCGTCNRRCTLQNVAINGCGGGSCKVVHCLPGWADTNGLAADGCEQLISAPVSDAGAGGSGGMSDGGTADSGPPVSVGTITCTMDPNGTTMGITILGSVSLGLMSTLPTGSINSLALGMDWGTCWPGTGNDIGCFGQSIGPATVDTVATVWTGIPRTRFTPRVTSSVWFDLQRWRLVGCKREGCGSVCYAGETCVPASGCTASGI